MSKILVAEDDELFGEMLGKTLESAGHQVVRVHDGGEALRLYNPATVDLVLTDLVMPDMEGTELIMRLSERYPGVKIIAMSGGGRNRPEAYLSVAGQLGAARTLAKPFSNTDLFAAIAAVLQP